MNSHLVSPIRAFVSSRVAWLFLVPALVAIVAAAPSSARATILINEVHSNPIGTDDNREFVELISTTGGAEPMTGLVFLLIDSNGGNIGTIDDAYNLNNYSTGPNGLFMMGNLYDEPVPGPLAGPWNLIYDPLTVLKDPSGADPFTGLGVGDFNNNGFTALIVSGFTGAAGVDLDVDNNNVFDTTPWTAIVDSVGWRVGALGVNSESTFALADLSNSEFTPDTVARTRGDFTPNSAAAWYGGDLVGVGDSVDYDTVQNFNLPVDAQMTPGSANHPVPEPSTWLLAATAAMLLVAAHCRPKCQ